MGSGPGPGVEALMLGAAVWQDRQGTTVKREESPRERPLKPPLRHRAAAFPIEPADPSAAESGARGRGGEAGGGGLGRGRGRCRESASGARSRPSRQVHLVPPAPASSRPPLRAGD